MWKAEAEQIPKLTVRVRFPSSTPSPRPRSGTDSERWALLFMGADWPGGPLAFKSSAAPAAPLARRQCRALPLSGPPGARRAADQYGYTF
jgi:hypothetical protein